jgi:hypothetical protein
MVGVLKSVGVMTVAVITVGEITVGVMRRLRKDMGLRRAIDYYIYFIDENKRYSRKFR